MLLHSTSKTRAGFILLPVGISRLAPESSTLGRDFGFDGCRQRSNALPGAFVELAIDKLDAEASLNFQNELQNIDGINLEIASQQRLVVAQIFGGSILDPQAGNNNLFELLRNIFHSDFSSSIAWRTGKNLDFPLILCRVCTTPLSALDGDQ
jgi:hypothetical protein